ncbi:hypothetical protein [Rheinheimera faecalis]
MIKIQQVLNGFSLICCLVMATVPLQAAGSDKHMTLHTLCDQLPLQSTDQQVLTYEQCAKQQGPEQIAKHFADIYQKKQGKVKLAYLDGGELVLQDFIADDAERYQNFSLWGCDNSKRYCVIFKGGWEWWSYLLIDRKTKLTTELTGEPVFSPDSQLVFEYLDTRNSDTFDRNIIKLYRLNDNKPKLLLALNDTDFGVRSMKWLTPSTLEATLQDFAPDDYYRYVAVGSMKVDIAGDTVKAVIEKTTQRK